MTEELKQAARQACHCQTCRPITMDDMRMVLCPTCGNKRCPHANDHRNACTNSNDPGQLGSAYPARALTQRPAAQAGEREQLRSAQADAVMPLIGPLLDAWENAARDVMSQEPELLKQLKAINNAMEGASLPTQPAQTDNMGMPTSCGKPLCAPDEHHPLCKLHKPAQAAQVPDIDYQALIHAAWRTHKYAQGTRGCIAFKHGAEWFRGLALAAAQAKGGE